MQGPHPPPTRLVPEVDGFLGQRIHPQGQPLQQRRSCVGVKAQGRRHISESKVLGQSTETAGATKGLAVVLLFLYSYHLYRFLTP